MMRSFEEACDMLWSDIDVHVEDGGSFVPREFGVDHVEGGHTALIWVAMSDGASFCRILDLPTPLTKAQLDFRRDAILTALVSESIAQRY